MKKKGRKEERERERERNIESFFCLLYSEIIDNTVQQK